MKKLIREILVEETQSMNRELDRIRRAALDQHFELHGSHESRSCLWVRITSLLPPWQWAALTGAWLAVGTVHLCTPSAPVQNSGAAARFMQQREMLGDVLRSMDKPPPSRTNGSEIRGGAEHRDRLA